MKTALIAVDYQNDFLPGGPLAVPDGDQVGPELLKLADRVDLIICTRDWHPEDHVSFSDDPEFVDGSWPKHCVQYSDGAKIEEGFFGALCNMAKPYYLVNKGMDQATEAYSGFQGIVTTTGEPLLPLLEDHLVSDVIIGGLALDYCVVRTALHAAAEEFETTLAVKATRPVHYATGALAIGNLVKAGVQLI